jgi:arginyl-tRNA--protein-N-Asp/Glu arginylyltransferase
VAAFKVTYVDPGKKKEIGAHLCKNCKQCIAVRYGIGEYGYSQTKRKIIARWEK